MEKVLQLLPNTLIRENSEFSRAQPAKKASSRLILPSIPHQLREPITSQHLLSNRIVAQARFQSSSRCTTYSTNRFKDRRATWSVVFLTAANLPYSLARPINNGTREKSLLKGTWIWWTGSTNWYGTIVLETCRTFRSTIKTSWCRWWR